MDKLQSPAVPCMHLLAQDPTQLRLHHPSASWAAASAPSHQVPPAELLGYPLPHTPTTLPEYFDWKDS